MKITGHKVTCSQCQTELSETTDKPFLDRKPCPKCGSKSRHFEVLIQNELFFMSKLRMKGRRGGKGRPFIESVKGDDLFKKINKWMKLERVIDRENDKYRETISDPETGQLIHRCEEPLSQHKGHGSAKKRGY